MQYRARMRSDARRAWVLPDAWLQVAVLLLVSVGWVAEWQTGDIPNGLTLSAMVVGLLLGLVDRRAVAHLVAFVGSAVVCVGAWSAGYVGEAPSRWWWPSARCWAAHRRCGSCCSARGSGG
ncbi:MAG: hypothetical protein EOO70_01075 [Myxococcaceae bacterium]|nr:MAG: hypothetical protein EOO70_01075 [Myxococcaceae bacterium]